MTLDEYYNGPFRDDLTRVIAALPSRHDHRPHEIAVQPRTLSRLNPIVQSWDVSGRMLFASSLFLTVLADQVCYTHFRSSYSRFRELTAYPKWRGDCPGGCRTNIEPVAIFVAIGSREGPLGSLTDVPFVAIPNDLFATMQREVLEFVRPHLREVDPQEFWQKCDDEVRFDFRMLYDSSRPPAV
jgi:hypothetical protein